MPVSISDPQRPCSAAQAQAFDSNEIAAYYIPSKHPFVESGAVRQSIREREGAYRFVQKYANLRERGVLLALTWQESFATRLGANQLVTLSGQELQAISAEQ
jgi:hypothetical protein